MSDEILLDVNDLTVRFSVGGGGIFGKPKYLYAKAGRARRPLRWQWRVWLRPIRAVSILTAPIF